MWVWSGIKKNWNKMKMTIAHNSHKKCKQNKEQNCKWLDRSPVRDHFEHSFSYISRCVHTLSNCLSTLSKLKRERRSTHPISRWEHWFVLHLKWTNLQSILFENRHFFTFALMIRSFIFRNSYRVSLCTKSAERTFSAAHRTNHTFCLCFVKIIRV